MQLVLYDDTLVNYKCTTEMAKPQSVGIHSTSLLKCVSYITCQRSTPEHQEFKKKQRMTFQFYSGSFIELLPKKSCYNLYTQRIHVWCIYLHLAGFYGKCWQIYQSHGSYGIQHGSFLVPTTPPLRSSSPGSDLAFMAWIFWPWKTGSVDVRYISQYGLVLYGCFPK